MLNLRRLGLQQYFINYLISHFFFHLHHPFNITRFQSAPPGLASFQLKLILFYFVASLKDFTSWIRNQLILTSFVCPVLQVSSRAG